MQPSIKLGGGRVGDGDERFQSNFLLFNRTSSRKFAKENEAPQDCLLEEFIHLLQFQELLQYLYETSSFLGAQESFKAY